MSALDAPVMQADQSGGYLPAFTLAHRAFPAAMMLARPFALIFRFFGAAGATTGAGAEPDLALTFAQRA